MGVRPIAVNRGAGRPLKKMRVGSDGKGGLRVMRI